jgi:hypothetical protein
MHSTELSGFQQIGDVAKELVSKLVDRRDLGTISTPPASSRSSGFNDPGSMWEAIERLWWKHRLPCHSPA